MTTYRVTYRDPRSHKQDVEADSHEAAIAEFMRIFQNSMEITNVERLYPFEVNYTTLVTSTTTVEATDKNDATRMVSSGQYNESKEISATDIRVIDVREITKKN